MSASSHKPSSDIRRIDQFIVDILLGIGDKLLKLRYHSWLWWHYTFREPFTEPLQANEALQTMCGYRIVTDTKMKLKCCVPLIRGLRFGVLAFFVPAVQRSKHWTLCWVRWIQDPIELYLARSAVKATPTPRVIKPKKIAHPQPVKIVGGLLESMSPEEMGRLLHD